MSDAGYKAFLELGFTERKNGNFISFQEEHIELDICSYSFIRGVDVRGKIETDLRGGNISFVLSKLPSLMFLDWCTTPNKYYSGYIHIKDLYGEPKERVFFEDATCVNMKITYMNEGTSYVMIQGLLQAELIQLPGSRALYNNWCNKNDRNSSRVGVKEAKSVLGDRILLNTDVSLSAGMLLGNTLYPLQSFEMEFTQEIDHKGEPQSSVLGGVATVALYSLPDESLNQWLRSNDERDGRFLFGDEQVGYPLSMNFKKACCSGYFVEVRNFTDDNITARLNIVPKSIDFGNGVSFKVSY